MSASETCPVCGMAVDPASSPSSTHNGTTYHFCCDDCKRQFDADPEKFVGV